MTEPGGRPATPATPGRPGATGADGVIRAVPDHEAEAGGLRVLRTAAFADLPGLSAGITLGLGRRGGDDDFGLSTGGSSWDVSARFGRLAGGLGLAAACVCRQVHGTALVAAEDAPPAGLWIPGEADGFVGGPVGGPGPSAPGGPGAAGRMFAVTVADCAPVYLVDPEAGAFALLHAGWRGAAGGILARALGTLERNHGRPPSVLHLHVGPAVCGDCYEVGPEVVRAFGREPPAAPRLTIDLRAEIARQAVDLGIEAGRITRSALCTRCERERLHSHRGSGERAGRMAAWIGWKV